MRRDVQIDPVKSEANLPGMSPSRRNRLDMAIYAPAGAGVIALQAVILLTMGLPLICACGNIDFWHGNPSGPETSQHLTDWYTYTHVIHGFGFYLLLWLIMPKASFGLRLALAIGLEAGWEIVENTPFVMDRYRQSALARGYMGDSVINSVFDTLATIVGFVFARIAPLWASIAVVILIELILGYMIRDGLTLNVIQLIWPSETISTWQTGG
jgi:hypothetical protein